MSKERRGLLLLGTGIVACARFTVAYDTVSVAGVGLFQPPAGARFYVAGTQVKSIIKVSAD